MIKKFIVTAVFVVANIGPVASFSIIFSTPKGVVIPNKAVEYLSISTRQAFALLSGCSPSSSKGMNGRYDVTGENDEIKHRFNGDQESLIGYIRAKCIMGLNQFKMFDKISYCNLPSKCRKFLSSQVNDIKKLGASNDVAQRYSLMCAFDISWDDSVKIMKGIAKEGPFSHEYSLEEALFITHMHTKMPNAVSRWLKGNEYHEEELTYAGCLASSLATVLKADEKLPEDFTFDHAGITTTSRESFINMNIRKFIDAYLGE